MGIDAGIEDGIRADGARDVTPGDAGMSVVGVQLDAGLGVAIDVDADIAIEDLHHGPGIRMAGSNGCHDGPSRWADREGAIAVANRRDTARTCWSRWAWRTWRSRWARDTRLHEDSILSCRAGRREEIGKHTA